MSRVSTRLANLRIEERIRRRGAPAGDAGPVAAQGSDPAAAAGSRAVAGGTDSWNASLLWIALT